MANNAAGTFPVITGYGFQALNVSMAETLTITSTGSSVTMFLLSLNSSVGVACSLTSEKNLSGEMITGISIATISLGDLTLEAVMHTLVGMGFVVPVYDNATGGWVMNMDTNAFSRYADFPFNSFGYFDGKYLGAKEDGVYVLDGSLDDTAVINSMVDFGRIDFGTLALKHITNVYVGAASDGTLYLKVIANGEEYVYSARAYDPALKVQRFDTGKGLRANYYDFELHGNGASLDLSSIEFVAIPTTRRI